MVLLIIRAGKVWKSGFGVQRDCISHHSCAEQRRNKDGCNKEEVCTSSCLIIASAYSPSQMNGLMQP